jgi:hypothetical protein
MGGEAGQQLLPQAGGGAAEGVERIGTGGLLGETLQQLPPQAAGLVGLACGLRR